MIVLDLGDILTFWRSSEFLLQVTKNIKLLLSLEVIIHASQNFLEYIRPSPSRDAPFLILFCSMGIVLFNFLMTRDIRLTNTFSAQILPVNLIFVLMCVQGGEIVEIIKSFFSTLTM